MQEHLSQGVSEAEERDREVEELSRLLSRRLGDKARQDETIASIDQALMHVQAQIELVDARHRSSASGAGYGSPSSSAPSAAASTSSVFPFSFPSMVMGSAASAAPTADAQLEALRMEFEELSSAREDNARRILAAASSALAGSLSFDHKGGSSRHLSVHGGAPSAMLHAGGSGYNDRDEEIDEDLPFTLGDSCAPAELGEGREEEALGSGDEDEAESSAGGSNGSTGIMNGAWFQRLGAGLGPAGRRWLQVGGKQQQQQQQQQ